MVDCQIRHDAQVKDRRPELWALRVADSVFGLFQRSKSLPAELAEPLGNLKRRPLGPQVAVDGVGNIAGDVGLPPVAGPGTGWNGLIA